MIGWEKLKRDKAILGRIDWDITPAQAFEAYQIKSTNSWRNRDLEEVYYFYLSAWRGQGKVLLVRRTYVESEEIAEAPAPEYLIKSAMDEMDGQDYPRGQMPLNDGLKKWLSDELKNDI